MCEGVNLDRLVSKFKLIKSIINDEDQKDDNIMSIEAKEEQEAEVEGGDDPWMKDTITYYSLWFW